VLSAQEGGDGRFSGNGWLGRRRGFVPIRRGRLRKHAVLRWGSGVCILPVEGAKTRDTSRQSLVIPSRWIRNDRLPSSVVGERSNDAFALQRANEVQWKLRAAFPLALRASAAPQRGRVLYLRLQARVDMVGRSKGLCGWGLRPQNASRTRDFYCFSKGDLDGQGGTGDGFGSMYLHSRPKLMSSSCRIPPQPPVIHAYIFGNSVIPTATSAKFMGAREFTCSEQNDFVCRRLLCSTPGCVRTAACCISGLPSRFSHSRTPLAVFNKRRVKGRVATAGERPQNSEEENSTAWLAAFCL